MFDSYATPDDLAQWLDTDVPDNAGTLLRYASILVAKACQRNIETDTPTDTDAATLRDATCVQAASWIALGVDPAKAGTDMPGPVKSSTILDATVARDTTAAAVQAVEAVKGLCDLASDLLQTAGLLWLPLPLGDAAPYLPHYGLSGPGSRWGYGPLAAEIDGYSTDAFRWPFI